MHQQNQNTFKPRSRLDKLLLASIITMPFIAIAVIIYIVLFYKKTEISPKINSSQYENTKAIIDFENIIKIDQDETLLFHSQNTDYVTLLVKNNHDEITSIHVINLKNNKHTKIKIN